jgi:thioredoxin 1
MKEQLNGGAPRGGTMIPRWVWVLVVAAMAIGVYLIRPAADSQLEIGGPAAETGRQVAESLPRLVDLGADKCVPCKMMAPILEELKVDYRDSFAVEFIDVWKDRDAGTEYGIKMIPTQIFFSADGTELFRHEGFFGKEEILAKWRELGIEPEPRSGG